MKGWYLGAYAGYASLADKSVESDARYWDGLTLLPHLAGLELPFYSDLSESGRSDKFLRTLPKHWDYIITLLPGTMQSLALQPDYGLASKSSEGRKAALSRMALVHRRIHEINDRMGRQAVRGIEIHSAPTRTADAESLYRSLEELETWDWQGARILLEHCDAWRGEAATVKGFLSLKDELAAIKQFSVEMSLNWGRSALEEQRENAAIDHIKQIAAASGPEGVDRFRLGAFFFSGTALEDDLYGSWKDSHAPLKLDNGQPWDPKRGLLSPQRVTEVCRELLKHPEVLLGIKVQPAPSTLTVDQRLDFLAQQILAFEKARQAASV